ncbi:MAG: hypothetical protein L0220_22810 [Acidobacteria bacterium]|nr:hypothetical protein [Acidobacteriota bacterium]
MDRNEAIEKTIRHVLGILKIWIIYFGLAAKFPRFFPEGIPKKQDNN